MDSVSDSLLSASFGRELAKSALSGAVTVVASAAVLFVVGLVINKVQEKMSEKENTTTATLLP